MFTIGIFMQFILEVLGAGGAIWGMSEVWGMRGYAHNDPGGSNDRLRIAANIVFTLGATRMFFRYAPDWGMKQALVNPHQWILDFGKSKRKTTPEPLQGAFAFEGVFFVVGVWMQFVLEVLGAGGAWWGMSEVWGFRGYAHQDPGGSNDQLRYVSNSVFAIAAIRVLMHYLPVDKITGEKHQAAVGLCGPHDYDLTPGGLASFQLEAINFLVGVFMQFVLEVLGAGGAWWGMSEVWGWRGYGTSNPGATNDDLRPVSNVVFAIACIRMIQKYMTHNGYHHAMLAPHDWVQERIGCSASNDQGNPDTQRPEVQAGGNRQVGNAEVSM